MSSFVDHNLLIGLIKSHPDWPIIQTQNPTLSLDRAGIGCKRLISHYLGIEVINNPSWVNNFWKSCKPMLNQSIRSHVPSVIIARSSSYIPAQTPIPAPNPIVSLTPSAIADLISDDPFKDVSLVTSPIAQIEGHEEPLSEPIEIIIPSEPDTLDTLAKAVLSPIAPFAAPSVLSSMQASLDALIAHAKDSLSNAQATSSSLVPASPGTLLSQAFPSSTVALAKAFELSVKSPWSNLPIRLWSGASNLIPIDPNYVHDIQTLGLILSATERGTNVWLWGPKGSGKTELSMQIAARLHRPYVRIPFADDMDKYSLVGQRLPTKEEGFQWHDGILSQAIRQPGCVIALDEPTLAKPGTLALIQTLIDTRRLSIEETGEVIIVAPGVMFLALDNTSGFGDETGRYAGTGVMNEAFLNRFPRKIEVDRMDSTMVSKIITSRTNLKNPQACDELAKLLRLSEDCARLGKTSTHLSLRDVLCFASDLAMGLPAQACLDATLLAALPPTEREAFRQNVLAHGMPLDQLAMLAYASTHTSNKGN